jgi:hypothetical protein
VYKCVDTRTGKEPFVVEAEKARAGGKKKRKDKERKKRGRAAASWFVCFLSGTFFGFFFLPPLLLSLLRFSFFVIVFVLCHWVLSFSVSGYLTLVFACGKSTKSDAFSIFSLSLSLSFWLAFTWNCHSLSKKPTTQYLRSRSLSSLFFI